MGQTEKMLHNMGHDWGIIIVISGQVAQYHLTSEYVLSVLFFPFILVTLFVDYIINCNPGFDGMYQFLE